MTENDLLYTLALQHVHNIGDITAKRLISNCGSAENVFKEKKQNLLKIDGIGSVSLNELIKSHHLNLITRKDPVLIILVIILRYICLLQNQSLCWKPCRFTNTKGCNVLMHEIV